MLNTKVISFLEMIRIYKPRLRRFRDLVKTRRKTDADWLEIHEMLNKAFAIDIWTEKQTEYLMEHERHLFKKIYPKDKLKAFNFLNDYISEYYYNDVAATLFAKYRESYFFTINDHEMLKRFEYYFLEQLKDYPRLHKFHQNMLSRNRTEILRDEEFTYEDVFKILVFWEKRGEEPFWSGGVFEKDHWKGFIEWLELNHDDHQILFHHLNAALINIKSEFKKKVFELKLLKWYVNRAVDEPIEKIPKNHLSEITRLAGEMEKLAASCPKDFWEDYEDVWYEMKKVFSHIITYSARLPFDEGLKNMIERCNRAVFDRDNLNGGMVEL